MIIRGVGGGVLTSLTSTSLTLRNMYMLLTCCTCFLTRFCVVTADGARGFAASCTKDYHHKRFKMAQINHKQNTFTKGKSYRTIVAVTQQMDGTWKHLKKWQPMSVLHKKLYKRRCTWAYSWTWRHSAALLQSVASALPQALWHWSIKKRKKLEEWMSPWYDSDDCKS